MIVTSPATTVGTLPTNPIWAGHTFTRWNTRADGGGSAFGAATTVTASITVYAQWIGETYTVTFKRNYEPDTTLYTRDVTLPATEIGRANFPGNPSRTGYNFIGWNTEAGGLGSAFTASTTVNADTTVYARWTTGNIITLNPDTGDGAFSQGNFTILKSGAGSQTVSVTGSDYTNPRWLVDGKLKGTGASITINAAEYGVGGHSLSLLIVKDGIDWSKDISFTVEE
jgi:uncharacterized repeat protein (TIGR02543 family)